MNKPPQVTACFKPSGHIYLVAFERILSEDIVDFKDSVYTALDSVVQEAIEDMGGISIFSNVWIIKKHRTTPEKLRNELQEHLHSDQRLMVTPFRMERTYGKRIDHVLERIDEFDPPSNMFMGQLLVEPNSFSIDVNKLVLHDQQLIVNCRTRDYESGQRNEYSLRARQNKEGVYEAELQDLNNMYEQ